MLTMIQKPDVWNTINLQVQYPTLLGRIYPPIHSGSYTCSPCPTAQPRPFHSIPPPRSQPFQRAPRPRLVPPTPSLGLGQHANQELLPLQQNDCKSFTTLRDSKLYLEVLYQGYEQVDYHWHGQDHDAAMFLISKGLPRCAKAPMALSST